MSVEQMRTKMIAEMAQCDVSRYYFDSIYLLEVFDKIEDRRDQLEFWKIHCIFFMTWPHAQNDSRMQAYTLNCLFYSLREIEWRDQTKKTIKGHIKHLDKFRGELERAAHNEYWIDEKGENSPCT